MTIIKSRHVISGAQGSILNIKMKVSFNQSISKPFVLCVLKRLFGLDETIWIQIWIEYILRKIDFPKRCF